MIRLRLRVADTWIPLFYPLLEKGVVTEATTGCSVRDFLCGELGLADDYLERRVQTLFLNGRPVDDPDEAVVVDGATLALSAAMPGLLGATMRKAGRYASMRDSISQSADGGGICQQPGRVTLKLFNMVAREFGRHLLQRGVEVDAQALQRILDAGSADPGLIIGQAFWDDQEITPAAIRFSTLSGDRAWLSVSAATVSGG